MEIFRYSTAAVIAEVVSTISSLSPAEIIDDLDLLTLDLDSLDLSTALVDIEDKLDLEIPASVLDQLFESGELTVASLVESLAALREVQRSRSHPQDA